MNWGRGLLRLWWVATVLWVAVVGIFAADSFEKLWSARDGAPIGPWDERALSGHKLFTTAIRARNPQTGEEVVLDGKEWKPLETKQAPLIDPFGSPHLDPFGGLPSVAKVRQEYPQYNDLSDEQLGERLQRFGEKRQQALADARSLRRVEAWDALKEGGLFAVLPPIAMFILGAAGFWVARGFGGRSRQ